MRKIARECTESLFADYGVQIQAVPALDPRDGFLYCGVIGFAGKRMRGSLILAATRGILESSAQIGSPELRDWIAELANQTLGRIKNQILARGQVIHAATPAVFRGEHLAPIHDDERESLAFSSPQGDLCVWIDLAADPDLVFAETILEGCEEAPMVAEGAALFF